MTDRDTTAEIISTATLRALQGAVASVRVNEGILLTERTIKLPEIRKGVTAVMVGEADSETPAQFIVVLKEPKSDTTPINRDIHILGEQGILSFRMERDYTKQELIGIHASNHASLMWQMALADLSEDERFVEEARFEMARDSIMRSIDALNDLKDLNAAGDIDDAEFDKRVGAIRIDYMLEPTEADEEEEYHDAYVAYVYAYHSYMLIIDGVVRDADCALADIIDGDTPLDEDVYSIHMSEGEIWNMINLLDGVASDL